MRQTSSIQKALITNPPTATSVASPQAAVIRDQNARQTAMIHTRFTNAIAHAAEAYPHVNFHVFTPEEEDRLVLSGSPMKYNVRTQIIDVAYRCAVEKIQDRADLLRVHMARHGFQVRQAPRPR